MFRCLLWVIAAAVRPKVLLIADNLCLGNSCWSCSVSARTSTYLDLPVSA